MICLGVQLAPLAKGQSKLPSEAAQKTANQWINEHALRADIRFLADDLLEGRGPGTRGDLLAQKYIASQFELLGLKPVGDDGKWTQEVPLVGVTTKPPSSLTFKHGDQDLKLKQRDDFIVTSGIPAEKSGFSHVEVVGPVQRTHSNFIHGITHLPVVVHP